MLPLIVVWREPCNAFFFNVRDGRDIFDATGTELAGLKEVRVHMLAIATGLLEEEEAPPDSGFDWLMEVLDGAGTIVCTMGFSVKMTNN